MQEQRVKQGAEHLRPRPPRRQLVINQILHHSWDKRTQYAMWHVAMDVVKDGVRKGRSRFLSELLGCHRVSHHKMRITLNKETIMQVATDVSASVNME
jgi:hypothetical protein